MRCPSLAELPPGEVTHRGWPWEEESEALPSVMADGTPWPCVSIVTPSYNQGQFIEETIRSVLLQGYPNLEYAVIDGGSTDGSLNVIKKYERFLSFWVSERDEGQAQAINKGWKRARGEVLGWINSDDIYLPGAVTKAVSYLADHQQVGMVYGEGYHIDVDGRIVERYPTEKFDADRLGDTCYICQPTTFIRRSVMEKVGPVDESLRFCMDYDLWIRISQQSVIDYLSDYFAHSRLHEESKTIKQAVPRAREALDMLYRHYRSVPPLKVGGYARAILATQQNRKIESNRPALIMSMVRLCVREFLRYNRRIPLSQMHRWGGGLLEGFSKLIKTESSQRPPD
ncbi:MAG: glycosyltransferase [Nitrospira sp. CG24E]|nr:MAG: glycosyltransferase [Nitrospira sp. CG24E]